MHNLSYQDLLLSIPNIDLSKRVGRGVDGEVYKLKTNKPLVVKVSLCIDPEHQLTDKINTLCYISRTKYPIHANIYDVISLNRCYKIILFEKKFYSAYSYIMEELVPISEDEYKVFHDLVSHEDNNIIKDLSPLTIKKIKKRHAAP